jgi:hypothetical protein
MKPGYVLISITLLPYKGCLNLLPMSHIEDQDLKISAFFWTSLTLVYAFFIWAILSNYETGIQLTFYFVWAELKVPLEIDGISLFFILSCVCLLIFLSEMPRRIKPAQHKQGFHLAGIPYSELFSCLDQTDVWLLFIGTVIFYTVSKKSFTKLFWFLVRYYIAVGATMLAISSFFGIWGCLGAFWILIITWGSYLFLFFFMGGFKRDTHPHGLTLKALSFLAFILSVFCLKIFLINMLGMRELVTNSPSHLSFMIGFSWTVTVTGPKFISYYLLGGWILLFLPLELLVVELSKRNQPEDLVEFLYMFYLSIGITVFFCGYCGFTPIIDIMPVIWHFCYWLAIYHIGNYFSDTSSPESHLQLFKLITGGGVCAGLVKTYFYFAYLIAYPYAATDLSPFLWLGAFALLSFWLSLILVFNYVLRKYKKYSKK